MSGEEFVPLSLTPLLIGTFAAIACALPGNFLVLRKQALIGDAISHVVLPGIVVAFLLTGAISTWPMMLGAAGAAVVAVVMIEAIRRLGQIEPGAAMGVVFTTMFAGGVLLLEQTDTSTVHLDVEHALYGNLESLIWLDATDWSSLLDLQALAGLPPELPRIALTLTGVLLFTWLFWRPLKISTFDEGFARTIGIRTGALGMALVIIAAIAAVAAFDAVGVDHRDCNVHLPASCGTDDDQPVGSPDRLECPVRNPFRRVRLCFGRLWPIVVGGCGCCQRRWNDRHDIRPDSGADRCFWPMPNPQRSAQSGVTWRIHANAHHAVSAELRQMETITNS